ncbi:MAG: ABC transporter permease subunit, partial [Cytophagales bacterium]
IELLLTKAVSDREVVLGKFLATLLLICIALVFTIPYVITLSNIGNLDLGATICGYLGLVMMSITYIGIGIYASSITNNQIVAFLLALFIGLFFHIIFDVLAPNFTGWLGEIFVFMSLSTHFESISRGVLDTKDIIYFLSLGAVGILLVELSLAKRNLNS